MDFHNTRRFRAKNTHFSRCAPLATPDRSWHTGVSSVFLAFCGVIALSPDETMATGTAAATKARRAAGTQLPAYVFETGEDLARHVALIVAGIIRERNALGQNAVLGLPTGSTPVSVYRELARMHREEGLDLSGVITFNLDEYYGLHPDQLQSYHRWMHEQFFSKVNVKPENIHIPRGDVPLSNIDAYCREYESEIERAGGIDLMILGIGGNGHIGFNEPFSVRNSRTRLCTLDPVTRRAAASDFFGEWNVPTQAITMGLDDELTVVVVCPKM
jgi:glucosamine-6-phosphate deaminase